MTKITSLAATGGLSGLGGSGWGGGAGAMLRGDVMKMDAGHGKQVSVRRRCGYLSEWIREKSEEMAGGAVRGHVGGGYWMGEGGC